MLRMRVPEGTVSPLYHIPSEINDANRSYREPQRPIYRSRWVPTPAHFYGSVSTYLEGPGLYFEKIDTAIPEEPNLPAILSEEAKRYETYIKHINQIADSTVGVLPVDEVTVKMKFKIIE